MALNIIRSGQGESKPPAWQNILPLPKFTGPKFAGTAPIAKPVNIRLNTDDVDLFQPTGTASARIVLTSTTGLRNRIRQALEQPKFWNDNRLVSKLSKLITGALEGDRSDGLGNTYATYEFGRGKAAGPHNLRRMVAAFKKALDDLPDNIQSVTVDLPAKLPDGVDRADLIRELSEVSALSRYNHNFHKKYSHPTSRLKTVTFTKRGLNGSVAERAAREGRVIGESMNLTRHLVDAPANVNTTRYMSNQARALESPTLKVDVREGAWLEGREGENTKRMGLLLGVGQGNDKTDPDRDPRLVEMVYTPADGQYDQTILLVGKGIIFDTGGNNLKPSEYIHNMEGDMAGAAAVIGTMKALDKLQIPGVRVVGLAPMTENRIGSAATLPNDIHTARNGKTVQIANTDAEGRLVMSDAIHYGMETYKPDVVANIATLTGGKARGIGEQNAVGVSGNNPELLAQVKSLEKEIGRRVGMLPLSNAHHRWVTRDGKGKADVFNSVPISDARHYGVLGPYADSRDQMLAHAAQGAAFVREFLADPNTPWVHYDIAGAEFGKPDPRRGNDEWATGIGVEELFYLVKGLAEGEITANRAKTETVR